MLKMEKRNTRISNTAVRPSGEGVNSAAEQLTRPSKTGMDGSTTRHDLATGVAAISNNLANRPALDGLLSFVPSFKKVDGWLTESEGQLLFSHASLVKDGCIVDLGSFRGRSTVALCAGAVAGAGAEVFAIDPHEEFIGPKGGKFGPYDRPIFFKTMLETKLAKYVRVLDSTSQFLTPGWTKPVAMLFLDGDHRYKSVRADFDAWIGHLTDRATIIFADFCDEGPRQVISELTAAKVITKVEAVGKLAVFTFDASASLSLNRDAHVSSRSLVQKDLSENSVAYHVYYGKDGKYLYQPIPKCACTTIKTLLLELEGLHVDADEWKRHDKSRNGFPGVCGLTPRQKRELFNNLTPTFKFVVVRNPYTRLASAYRDKIDMVIKERADFWRRNIRNSARRLGIQLPEDISFEDFVRIVSMQSADEMDPHWRHQYLEGRFGFIKFNFIGHLEMLGVHLPFILEQIGAPPELHDRMVEPQNVTGTKMDIWNSVSSSVRQQFIKAFEIDFDTFCYPHQLKNN